MWGPDNLLFISAEYNAGAKVIELQRSNQQTKATELWSSNRLRLHHSNAMRIGDAIYFSSGGKGSQAILSAVDARTGTIHWQERSIQKASFVWADQKLITIAQDGVLMIAYPSPQGFKIAAEAQLLTELAWTPPVIRGHSALPSRPPEYDGCRLGVSQFPNDTGAPLLGTDVDDRRAPLISARAASPEDDGSGPTSITSGIADERLPKAVEHRHLEARSETETARCRDRSK